MTTKLIVIDGQIIGTTTPDDPNGYTLIDPPEGFDNELDGLEYNAASGTAHYNLSAYQARRTNELRAQAQTQIEALQWRIERATEREQLGLPGETLEAVLVEREALRRASNRCAAEVQAATTLDAVRAVVFDVTDADRATPNRITRLQFLSRFTDAEMQAVIAASDQSPALRAALMKWQTADGIVLTDAATVAGVEALEIAGLLTAGRAAEVLAT